MDPEAYRKQREEKERMLLEEAAQKEAARLAALVWMTQ
jgi:hypothetical protein